MTESTDLLTRNVFLDTEVFVRGSFSFGSKAFQALVDLAQMGSIHILITDVVQREVVRKQRQHVARARNALKNLVATVKEVRVLNNLQSPNYDWLFRSFDVNGAASLLRTQFDDFCANARVEIVTTNAVSITDILDDYFEKRAPFGEGMKAEFPDAISLAAIRNWCTPKDSTTPRQQVYVVSGNERDFVAACDASAELHYLENLEDFLDRVSRANGALATELDDALDARITELDDLLRARFEGCEFRVSDMPWEYTTISSVIMTDLVVTEEVILFVTPNDASVEFTATVFYAADIEYPVINPSTYEPVSGNYRIDELEHAHIEPPPR